MLLISRLIGRDSYTQLCKTTMYALTRPGVWLCLYVPWLQLQLEYWRLRTQPPPQGQRADTIEYANDVPGTAFAATDSGDPLASSRWNLNVSACVRAALANPVGWSVLHACMCLAWHPAWPRSRPGQTAQWRST